MSIFLVEIKNIASRISFGCKEFFDFYQAKENILLPKLVIYNRNHNILCKKLENLQLQCIPTIASNLNWQKKNRHFYILDHIQISAVGLILREMSILTIGRNFISKTFENLEQKYYKTAKNNERKIQCSTNLLSNHNSRHPQEWKWCASTHYY